MRLIDLFTEANNHPLDLKRILWAVGVLWFMAVETFAVAKGQPFDPQAVAIGMSGLLAAGGAALALGRGNEAEK